MLYRKQPLETLPSWTAVDCFTVGPDGNPVGLACEDDKNWFVVIWRPNGSILASIGPFDGISSNGALNAEGELVCSVHPKDEVFSRPVLIRDGKLVREFKDTFANSTAILGLNAAGVAVGAELIGKTTATRPFTLDVRGSGKPRYLEGPPRTVTASAAAINDAGDIVVSGATATGAWHSELHAGGVDRHDLGPYALNDINAHRVCSGFSLAPKQRAGLLDASASTPRWTELPMLPGAKSSSAQYVNDRGQCVGIADFDGGGVSSALPFLWSDGVLKELSELVAGSYFVPQGLGEGGEIATEDEGRPVLLIPARRVRAKADLGHPLWELVLIGSAPDGAPVFGIGGVSIRLPNGQVINLPVLPIPNDPVPGPYWSNLNEGQRVALVAAAVAGLASQVQDQHAKGVLMHAAHELLPHGKRK